MSVRSGSHQPVARPVAETVAGTGEVDEVDEIIGRLGELFAELAEDNEDLVLPTGPDDLLFLASLDAVYAKTAIEARYGVDVPLELFFGGGTLRTLAEAVRTLAPVGDDGAVPALVPRPEKRFEPFPLTDVQQAYWLGDAGFDLGGRSAHFYAEVDVFPASVERAEGAFNELISRHDMLRATVLADGRQQVARQVPAYRFRHADLRGLPEDDRRCRLHATREEMAGQVFDARTWPLYEIRAHSLEADRLRLHLSIDLLFVDAGSLRLLLAEWIRLILDPRSLGPAPEVTFRDYLSAAAEQRDTPAREAARAYWLERVDTLPPAPELPLQALPDGGLPVFTRRERRLSGHLWRRLKDRANALGVTPSVLLCTAYADVLRTWSKSPRFTVNVTLADRPRWHPDIPRLIGDFTSTVLLECDLTEQRDLALVAGRLQQRLRADLQHARFSGVALQREMARRHGGAQARMPVVFTSLLDERDGLGALEGVVFEVGHAVSQTPQVHLDNQVQLRGGELLVSWDAVAAAFPDGVLDDMFGAYVDHVERFAEQDSPAPVTVPARQLAVRRTVNATAGPSPYELIHAALDRQAAVRPDAPAVIGADRTLTFGELDRRANQIAHRLRELGAAPNTLVAVVMHKGWQQVAAVLGVVRAGAAYLPVDAALPPARIERLIAAGNAGVALVQPGVTPPAGATVVTVPQQPWTDVPDGPVDVPDTTPDDLAYVIFTSGSTGAPKGVMTSHRAAVNTLDDIRGRFGAGPAERVLGLSSLSFDLSVYDVFGVLGGGGAVVLPAPDESRDPGRWAELAGAHGVTLWNTVPALLELLVEHCERYGAALPATMRTVLLSGDWIPLALPGRFRAVSAGRPELTSLGGATEAAIWSIHHPIGDVDPAWRSIPYGTPLRNQTFHVLGPGLTPKPDHVPGELYIGGLGVARGYWGDPERTAERFLCHPHTGERLYRTGDLGRYLPDGTVEFLGRDDFQVKIGGHRIELGEIEVVLGGHPKVRSAVVVARDGRWLIAYVVPQGHSAPTADELHRHAAAELPPYMVPSAFVTLDRLPLTANGKLDRSALPAPAAAAEGRETPVTPVEEGLARAWAAVLPVERFGRHDNFFALGGDSLLGVRAVAKAAEHGLYVTLRELYAHPTLAGLATVARRTPPATAPQSAVTGRADLAAAQRWFFEQNFADPDHWNGMWPVFELDGPLDPKSLGQALTTVLGHHDGLRARFRRDERGWYAHLPDEDAARAAEVRVVDLHAVPDTALEAEIGRHAALRNGGLDLAGGRTLQLTYFDLGARRRPRLLVSAHWLVMDYYSSRVFYEDLRTAYAALERGETPALPPKTASLPQCAAQLHAYAAGPEPAAELPYWTRLAERARRPLPVDHRLGPNVQSSAVRHMVHLTGPTAVLVTRELPRTRGVEIREVLLTALTRTVTAWTGQPELFVELEGHGRERAFGTLDVSRTVARFSTLSPVALRPGDLDAVREQLRAVPNRGTGYGVLRYLHPDPEVRARLAAVPAPEVGFNFWGDVSEYFTGDARPVVESFGHHRSGAGHRPRVLDLMALTADGELRLVWTYSAHLHTAQTVRMLAERFTEELRAMAKEAG
ncbi:amino acid adenylation domain-containing protein [Streptomyces sp. NPDC090442]|uniref:amino acid adenylation domain-containing protein n=1 Tax=Streptomyces sp. NPDC090442 TaxID=3365962 RepID=UPI0038050EC3